MGVEMRYDLFDYQREAAAKVLQSLARGRRDWDEYNSLSAFALSAITGSGKTVIATAVIEAVIHGSADLDYEPDHEATFLWVTDDPALNRQTRNKMLAASDLLDPVRLVIVENDFLDSTLNPGRVYFLNIQKLSKTSGLAQGGNNFRQYSMWEIIRNTIEAESTDLYLVLDEAHRGMKQAADRKTIVQRIIGGQPDSNSPVPVTWGISATIERFTAAMEGAKDRTTYPPVAIDIDKVRASGIIKDQIDLDEPEGSGTVLATLLRSAVDTTLDYELRWSNYAAAEHEPLVLPVLVVQVGDKPTDAQLAEFVSIIEEKWPSLGPHGIVNVFGEHEDLVIGTRKVRWVPPESIQDAESIRVVLAKQAISTGWDCPRAEVLYSERAANDATHIAQVIGRMVRSPLARRIATDDALNSVACFLPRFDRSALAEITDELTRPGEPGQGSEVIVNSRLFDRNAKLPSRVFKFVEGLPSFPAPDALASPLRRAKALAKLLTDDDAPGGALLADAGEQLSRALNARLDGLAAENAEVLATNVAKIETANIRRTVVTTGGKIASSDVRTEATALRDIDRDTRRVVATIKEGVAKDYVRYRIEKARADADVLAVRTEVAALVMIDEVASAIDAVATKWVQDQFTKFAVEIKNTTGARRDAYLKVKEQISKPEETGIELTVNLKGASKDSNAEDADDLPAFPGHLYADAKGRFPAKLNDWETTVIEAELKRPSFVAWYRNPSRAAPPALRIAYEDDASKWSSLQVDFIVVSRRDDGSLAASIVDPHGDHLADAKAKLRGLADYAERFGHRYIRIESVAKVTDGRLRSLDLLDAAVRDLVRRFEGGKVTALYESDAAADYQ
jgi:type III restriction enzyme